MGAPVLHWQMVVKEPEKSASFYEQVFGWRVSTANSLGYREISTGTSEGIGGGIWPAPAEGQNLVQLFIGVDSVRESVDLAERHGARVLIRPQQLPDGDEIAVLVDPSGIPFGMMKKR